MHPLHEFLFGDIPTERFLANDAVGEPWKSFRAAEERVRASDVTGALALLSSIPKLPDVESRAALQAWQRVRDLGGAPPAGEAKRVLGVVVDVPIAGGLDTLAAYEDGTARYLNRNGGSVIWELRGQSREPKVMSVIDAGRALVTLIGPWKGARPPLAAGMTRLSLLTPSGLHFGQSTFAALSRDPKGGSVMMAATVLMKWLVERAKLDPKK